MIIIYKIIFKILALVKLINFLPDKIYLKMIYKIQLHKDLNLNNPQTFNEKIQWLKLYDRKPEYAKMVDKYEAKKYVSNIIGEEHIIPTIGIYEKFEDINFDKLPNQFVMKCTHDSGGIVICKNKKDLDIKQAKKKINKSLKRNYFYNGREWPYKNVKPRIIIEKYMKDNSKNELIDYKLMCFNGQCKIIFTCTDRYSNDGLKVTFFDLNWNKLPFERHYPTDIKIINKPKNLEKMLDFSKKLSKNIPFVRTDFYEINEMLYFGEMTFFPGSGFEEFKPEEWDKKIGDMIDLSLVGKDEK